MKYNSTARLMKFFLRIPVYKVIKKELPQVFTDDYKRRVNNAYRGIVERTEGVGGKDNPMEIILYFLAFLIAVYKSADGKMSEKTFEHIIDALGNSSMIKISSKLNGAFSKKSIKTYRYLAKTSKAQKYQNNWEIDFDYKKENEEFFMTYTQCALCKIGKKEGVFNIIKYLCKLDYYMFKHKNVVLNRTKTLAYGDECCNFHVMSQQRAKEINYTPSKNLK